MGGGLCLVAVVGEGGEVEATVGAGETAGVPALSPSCLVSEESCGAGQDVLPTPRTPPHLPPLPSGQHGLQVGKPSLPAGLGL